MKKQTYPLTYARQLLHEKCTHASLAEKRPEYKHECLGCLLKAMHECYTAGVERGKRMASKTRYQVFEKRPSGYTEIHNFKSKKAAEAKHCKLEARGWADGPIWDCQDNSLSNMFKF